MPLSRRMGSFHFVGTSRSLLRYSWAHVQRIFQLTAFSLQLGHVLMGESMEQGWHGVHSYTKQTFYFGANPFLGLLEYHTPILEFPCVPGLWRAPSLTPVLGHLLLPLKCSSSSPDATLCLILEIMSQDSYYYW